MGSKDLLYVVSNSVTLIAALPVLRGFASVDLGSDAFDTISVNAN